MTDARVTYDDDEILGEPEQVLYDCACEAMDSGETGSLCTRNCVTIQKEETISSDAIRTFETGATRNLDVDPDLYGFTSPLALALFGEYMQEKRLQADGTIRDSDNWKKGIPMDSYMRSMFRHMQDLRLIWDGYPQAAREDGDIVGAMCGLFFNVQGFMHEWSKEFLALEAEGSE